MTSVETVEAALEWRPVEGYPGYFVSSTGTVRGKSGRVLAPRVQTNGYLRVSLCRDDLPKDAYIHRLVARAFHGEPPSPDSHADHDNRNRQDNRRENIVWRAPTDNRARRVFRLGEDNPVAKLTTEAVRYIRSHERRPGLAPLLARELGVSREQVRDILLGKSWRHVQ